MKNSLIIYGIVLLAALCSCSHSGERGQYLDWQLGAYRNMRVGDWAFYDLAEGLGVLLQVTEADEEGVAIKRHSYFGAGAAQGSFDIEYKFKQLTHNIENGFDITGKIPISQIKIGTETVTVGGRTYNCTVYTTNTPGGEVETFVVEKLPLDGVVMVRRKGVVIRSLKAYGFAGEPIIFPDRSGAI